MKSMRDEGGASAVEFAIILPVLVLLVFGIIQFGIAYNRTQGLEAATREGARLASLGYQSTDVRDRVRQAQSLFVGTDVNVSYKVDGTTYTGTRPCQNNVGKNVEVSATVAPSDDYAISIPLLPTWQITYQATGTFRCEKSS